MKKEIRVYLDDILEAIERIEKYTKAENFESFSQHAETQDAVIRRIGVIGEAAKNLPAKVKRKYPEIPWRSVIAMRNIVIHEYNFVSLKRVWKVIENDLEPLKGVVKKALTENGAL